MLALPSLNKILISITVPYLSKSPICEPEINPQWFLKTTTISADTCSTFYRDWNRTWVLSVLLRFSSPVTSQKQWANFKTSRNSWKHRLFPGSRGHAGKHAGLSSLPGSFFLVSSWSWFLQFLFFRYSTSFPILSPEEGKKSMLFCLFKWLKYSCWLFLGVISLASAFFITLYSLELNKDQATSWVISMMLSVLQDIFVNQPIKVPLEEAGETEAMCVNPSFEN